MINLFKCIGLFLIVHQNILAQGPPIIGDKPIMLGSNSWVFRTLSELRNTEKGEYLKTPVIAHFLPSSKTLIGIHLPFIKPMSNGNKKDYFIGDIELIGKYQFYRKDETGKTLRLLLKTIQTLPTGKELNLMRMSMGKYANYIAVLAGYESVKIGIINELGFNYQPNFNNDEIRYVLSIGVPLLKPSYPVKQINLFFESQNSWFVKKGNYLNLFAPGIQYAKGRMTLETSYQFPLFQNIENKRKNSIFLGGRYIF